MTPAMPTAADAEAFTVGMAMMLFVAAFAFRLGWGLARAVAHFFGEP